MRESRIAPALLREVLVIDMNQALRGNVLKIGFTREHPIEDHPAGGVIAHPVVQPGAVILPAHDVGRGITPDPIGGNCRDGVPAVSRPNRL